MPITITGEVPGRALSSNAGQATGCHPEASQLHALDRVLPRRPVALLTATTDAVSPPFAPVRRFALRLRPVRGYSVAVSATPLDAAAALPPEALPARRRSLLRDAGDELRAVVRFRSLVRYMVSSSLRKEHTGTFFGFVWWLLDPLLLSAVYVVFVGLILHRGRSVGLPFPLFVLTAIIAWQFFASGVGSAIGATISKERAMRQVAFPRSVIPLSATLGVAVHFLFGLVVLVLIAIPFGIYPDPIVVLALPIAAVQLLFTLGVAFFLSALNVLFRDTGRLTSYAFRIWFYLSPALYSITLVPERYRSIFRLNPFTTFFPSYRAVLMRHIMPDFVALGVIAGASVVLLVIGYLFFVRLEPLFAKRI